MLTTTPANPVIEAQIEEMFRLADAAVADPKHKINRDQLGVNFPYFVVTMLEVEDKQSQQKVPFRFKPIQRDLTKRILRKWLAGEPCRLIILKARREGVSTLIKAFQFWVCWSMKHRKALTIAHDDKTSGDLHMILEKFYDWMPTWAQPMRGTYWAGRVLEFGSASKNKAERKANPGLESMMRTITLKNQGAGQGYSLVHLSEVALEGWSSAAGQKAMNTVLQTVPRAEFTLVAKESTARGVGNPFHADWNRAMAGTDEDEYEPVFYPWFAEPTNRMAVRGDFEPNPDEVELAEEFGLDYEQIRWRRWCIANQCRGNLDVFAQEHPATADEAFLSSGRPYFHQRSVKAYYDRATEHPPAHVGRFEERDDLDGDTNNGHGWSVWVKSPRQAKVRIWRPPNELEDYLIFADAAGGGADATIDYDTDLLEAMPTSTPAKDGDWQAAYVIRRSEMEIVASYHSRVSRTDYGDDLYGLGKFYAGVTRRDGRAAAGAKIAVEVTGGWGEVPLQRLRWRRYPRLYRQVMYDHRTKERQEVLGWHTTIKTRAQALDSLAQAIRNGELECYDEHLFRECSTFVYNEEGKPEAQPGCHDDRVVAGAGACHLWLHEGRRIPKKRVEPKVVLSSTTGY